jgi:hypothetical protein
MRCNQSTTDSSILCLTWEGESSEDIISELKKKHRHKSMKALIPVSPKKFGHYNGYKMDYPKNYNIKKHNPNNI